MSSSGNKFAKKVALAVIPNKTAVGLAIDKFETNNLLHNCKVLNCFIKTVADSNFEAMKEYAFQHANDIEDNIFDGTNQATISLNEFKKRVRSRQHQLQVFADINTLWNNYSSSEKKSKEDSVKVAETMAAIIRSALVRFDRTPKMEDETTLATFSDFVDSLDHWGRQNLELKLELKPSADDEKTTKEEFSRLLKADSVVEDALIAFKTPAALQSAFSIAIPKPQPSGGKIAGAAGLPFFIAGLVLLCTAPPVGALYCLSYAVAAVASAVAGWFLGGAIETGFKNSRWCQDDDSSPAQDESPKSGKGGSDDADRALSSSAVVQKMVRQSPSPGSAVTNRKKAEVEEVKGTDKQTSPAALDDPKTVSAAAKALAKSKTVAGKSGKLDQQAGDFLAAARQLREQQAAKSSSWWPF